ncbi:hypothetical protein [Lutimonas sp.]|uniref:hypothetical protein n=1 Tax=Lutimonas sp. TaxID=1872403 RepID=UPI003D9B31C4
MLKRCLFVFLVFIPFLGQAQDEISSDEHLVKEKVDDFFKALEKQDTIALKKLWFSEGQVWAIDNTTDPTTYSMRFFKEDLNRFDPKTILKESALSYEIKIHKGMAMAWVPYDFKVNGEFSHCGVDIFSLMKVDNQWKFISASYTVEKENCK